MSLWSDISFYFAVLYPFNKGLKDLDSRASAAIWTSLLITSIAIIIKPNTTSMRMFFVSGILRSIYSVGLGPTLWLMGAIQLKDYITIKDDGFINNWNQLMSYHKEQILCLTFYKSHRIKQFASTIESSFIHLQSLTLYHVESDTIIPVLMNLPSLSRLKSLVIEMFNIPIPRSNSPAWKRSVPSSSVDFVEAVFRLEIFPVISDQFLPESTGTLAGIRRKSPAVFLTGILLPCSSDFPCFPAGYGDFPAYSLEYPTGSGDWNVRPGLICTHTHTHTSTSLPIATHQQQQSNIECLIIDHPGTFQELSIIVSYALRVRSSKCTHAVNDTSNAPLVPLIKLENLINLSLHMYSVDFLDFERFIQRINSNLKN
ncbi:unnamed protein product [Rotaria magnacalcarata]